MYLVFQCLATCPAPPGPGVDREGILKETAPSLVTVFVQRANGKRDLSPKTRGRGAHGLKLINTTVLA